MRRNLTRTVGFLIWTAIVLISAVGCKKEEEKSSVTGNVAVPNGSNDNVVVELYTPPPIYTTSVWTTTAQYPLIGFRYNLQATWDFRVNRHLLKTTFTTGADGKFALSEITDGDYIIIARKTGYGWSVPRTISIHSNAQDIGTLALCTIDTLPSNAIISSDTYWPGNRHYLIQSRISIMNGATLTIGPGAVVRLPLYSYFQVLGSLAAEGKSDSFIVFTSNESSPLKSDWEYVIFPATADNYPVFRYCSFSYADQAVRSLKPGGRIEYCYFGTNGAFGASLVGNSDANLDSLVFRRNVMDNMSVGLIVSNVVSQRPMLVEKNAFFNCSLKGLEAESINGGAIYCNWFYNCAQTSPGSTSHNGALYLGSMNNTEIYRNEFRTAYYGIDLGSRVDSSVHIHHNYFYVLANGLHVGVTFNGRFPSYPRFTNNCLQSITGYYILMEYCYVNNKAIDATNNYWNGHTASSVPIFDHDEEPLCPYVSLSPVWSSCPREEVGVCRE